MGVAHSQVTFIRSQQEMLQPLLNSYNQAYY